ncbi:unnamed protein product [Oppiella nova]|uniref:Flavin-containing monooxygenase n=1 Tax=Oppiella nova TaxID=334625 RepID=A0A7R9MI92_9ACAR|nr:unnamed protein product [Oppiella nova]CAG2177878.1 unnamed protein product [Oppiella nova]
MTGRWRLTVRDTNNDRLIYEVFDGVMVCTGHNNKPSMPTYENQHIFKGLLMHSHAFKDNTAFAGKRVVVVGIGGSGCDATVELSNVCPIVHLSTRTGSWVTHRVGHKGKPFDAVMVTRFFNTMFNVSPLRLANAAVEWYLNMRFDHKLYGLKPKHRFLSKQILVNEDLPKKIMTGSVVIKGDIQEFTEHGVIFTGEADETLCDAVVFATGYQLSYPFLSESVISTQKSDFHLYKHIFPTTLTHPHTLAFIGIIVPTGAVLPIAELQSRYFALVMANKCQMATQKQMIRDIKRRKKWLKQHFPDWQKHALEVYYIKYMDELAGLMGVKPNLCKYFVTDPKLWFHMYFGPYVPYQYRLTGPNSWPKAREAILTVNERIKAPFKTRNK